MHVGSQGPAPWAWHMGLWLAAWVPSGRLAQQPCCALLGAPATKAPGGAGRKWGEELGPHCQPLPPAHAVSQTMRHRGWGGLTFVEIPPQLMVGAALHDLSHVLRFLVDWHGTDGSARGRRGRHLDLDGARLGDLAVQLLQQGGVLEERGLG